MHKSVKHMQLFQCLMNRIYMVIEVKKNISDFLILKVADLHFRYPSKCIHLKKIPEYINFLLSAFNVGMLLKLPIDLACLKSNVKACSAFGAFASINA